MVWARKTFILNIGLFINEELGLISIANRAGLLMAMGLNVLHCISRINALRLVDFWTKAALYAGSQNIRIMRNPAYNIKKIILTNLFL